MSQQQNPKLLEFAKRVISLRNRMGLNQVDFGKTLGVSDEYVSQIEKGKRDPGDTLKILVGFLEAKFQLRIGSDSNSVVPPVDLREESAEYKTSNEWKDEALKLRSEVTRLKVVIQILAATVKPVSSSDALDAEAFVTEIINRMAKEAAAKFPPGQKPKS